MTTKEDYIRQFQLTPHPEGGWYQQIYHSEDKYFDLESGGQRYRYTSIYFLLDSTSPSHFHRLNHDELWYFHAGQGITIHCISPNGHYQAVKLGENIQSGERLQFKVPKETIFASEVSDSNSFGFVSCMVAPGFDYRDFELLSKEKLLTRYPQHRSVIDRLAVDDTNQ